jgi:DNA-binding response OmpR family regulator
MQFWEVAPRSSVAYSAAEGHSLLEEHRPDVAILDISLGSATSDGIALLCHEQGTRVIYATGHTAERVSERASVALLVKPFSADQLAEALARAENS